MLKVEFMIESTSDGERRSRVRAQPDEIDKDRIHAAKLQAALAEVTRLDIARERAVSRLRELVNASAHD